MIDDISTIYMMMVTKYTSFAFSYDDGKKDLKDNRVVDITRGIQKATKQKMNRFVEVSAKTKENLMETFKEFYMEIYYRNKKKVVEKRNKNLKAY